ncbi:MAG: hypothetical protein K6F65_04250 [Lachnospiraceae bacterium]|nr:hypothetical protein [Lachnospiraceae bacterium]
MIDTSFREKYNISYLRTYIRPGLNEAKKPVLEYVYWIIAGMIFFCEPLLIVVYDNFAVVMSIWIANFVIFLIYGSIMTKRNRIEEMLNSSIVQEFVLTDKASGIRHPAYAFIQGYNMINRGTASAAAKAAYEEGSLWKYVFRDESDKKYYAAMGVRTQNVKMISNILHREDIQKKMADMIISNSGFFKDMGYIFFDKYRPLKKQYKSRYYAVPGYRGLEYKILIPIDCGFEEAIKDDMDFVYYKAAEKR